MTEIKKVKIIGSQIGFALDTLSAFFPGAVAKKIKQGRIEKGLTRKELEQKTKEIDPKGRGLKEEIIKDIEYGKKRQLSKEEKEYFEKILGVKL